MNEFLVVIIYLAIKGAGQPAMNRSKQAGMAIKTIVVFLVGLAFGLVHVSEAQQHTAAEESPADRICIKRRSLH